MFASKLLTAIGYPRWPTEQATLEQRYSDVNPAVLLVPTRAAFAASNWSAPVAVSTQIASARRCSRIPRRNQPAHRTEIRGRYDPRTFRPPGWSGLDCHDEIVVYLAWALAVMVVALLLL